MNLPRGIVLTESGTPRCSWAASAEDYGAYHDHEWGHPVTDDRRLFEKICLEGFQSGLSWLTILRKRENFRSAFADFDFEKVARFDQRNVERLVRNSAIVRHRGKIESTIQNARRALEIVDEFGSLAAYFWQFEPPTAERPKRMTQGALMKLTTTATSTRLSKDLKARAWTFVGPTTCYAFMQAMGLVNDHIEGCSARETVERKRARLRRPRTSSKARR